MMRASQSINTENVGGSYYSKLPCAILQIRDNRNHILDEIPKQNVDQPAGRRRQAGNTIVVVVELKNGDDERSSAHIDHQPDSRSWKKSILSPLTMFRSSPFIRLPSKMKRPVPRAPASAGPSTTS